MKKIKLMTIVGTRPELIRLSRIIPKADTSFNHILVHTGQNYDFELNQIFFNDLGIRKPDEFLNCAGEGKSPMETIATLIQTVDAQLDKHQPDAILILGDTNSSLAALPAKRKKIPIFHMEAGNRCFDQRVPEEINRRIVDHLADINLPYSHIAREYLLREGIPPDQIIKTSSPMAEVLDFYKDRISSSHIIRELGIETGNYYVVSAHREENIDNPENFSRFVTLIEKLAQDDGLPVVVTTHPRTRKKIEAENISFSKNIQFLKPLGFFDYITLQKSAACVLSDSGTITEESSILNFDALNLRETNERPEGFEEGATMMVGLDYNVIRNALDILKSRGNRPYDKVEVVEDYKAINVSQKVINIILSYTSYINMKIWKK